MDQFVTTYRKDFLWPYVRVLGAKPHAENYVRFSGPQQGQAQGDLCACNCLDYNNQKPVQVYGPESLKLEVWARKAPVGPLLDPLMYPAQVGRSPEVDTMRADQPNTFLRKLQEKYPYIYEVLRTAPPDDMISRINKDRLRSTYQVDYCHMNEYPSAPYDELLRAAGVVGLSTCAEPVRLPGDPCRPNQRAIAFRPATITKEGKIKGNIYGIGGGSSGGGGSGGGGGGGGGGPARKPGGAIGGSKTVGMSMGGGGQSEGISSNDCLMWNPFRKDSLKGNKRMDEWGHMIYRYRYHAHGNKSVMRGKNKM